MTDFFENFSNVFRGNVQNNQDPHIDDEVLRLAPELYKDITSQELEKKKSSLNLNKSSGLDGLVGNITLPIHDIFKLFDTCVGSVLWYGSEIWDYHDAVDIERVHTKFCRSILRC